MNAVWPRSVATAIRFNPRQLEATCLLSLGAVRLPRAERQGCGLGLTVPHVRYLHLIVGLFCVDIRGHILHAAHLLAVNLRDNVRGGWIVARRTLQTRARRRTVRCDG